MRLGAVNLLFGVLLMVSSMVGFSDTINNQRCYGLVYDKTIIIGEETYVESVNLFGSYVSSVLVAVMGVVFMVNAVLYYHPLRVLANPYDIDPDVISFPKGEPEDWSIETDPHGETVRVNLGGYAISLPRRILEEAG